MLDVRYKNKKLQKICTDAETARASYGNEMARKLHLRIDQLEAADSIQELILVGAMG